MQIALLALLLINALGLLLMRIDKEKARRHRWRISEATLFTVALLGGSAGVLLGMYAFFEVEYTAAGGYLISSVPMGAVLAAALAFSIAALRLFAALRRRYRRKKLLYRCKIVLSDGREYAGMGLLDTGNHLLFCGRPVSLVDPAAAERLFGGLPPEEDMPGLSVHTATGDGELKVFPARLMIYSEGRENIIDNVYFALASAPLGKGYDVILHPRLCKEEGTPC